MIAPIPSNTLTPAQHRVVLEVIAGRMNSLNRLLLLAQTRGDNWEAETLLDVAQFMTEAVGAMADDAIGGEIIGDMRRWFYGPVFAQHAEQGRVEP